MKVSHELHQHELAVNFRDKWREIFSGTWRQQGPTSTGIATAVQALRATIQKVTA